VELPFVGRGAELTTSERVLVKANLIMEVLRDIELGVLVSAAFDPPPVDRDLGVGQHYAWQVPVYKGLLRSTLRQS